jgi:hypothetical protein
MATTTKNGAGFVVGKGDYFRAKTGEKNEGQLVCVFFADMSEIAYAPVGSSKEFRTDQESFLEAYDRVLPEQLEKEAAKEQSKATPTG